jgi:hypothetical protein
MENFGKIYDDFALDISMDSLQARYLGLFLPFLSNLSGIINSKIVYLEAILMILCLQETLI